MAKTGPDAALRLSQVCLIRQVAHHFADLCRTKQERLWHADDSFQMPIQFFGPNMSCEISFKSQNFKVPKKSALVGSVFPLTATKSTGLATPGFLWSTRDLAWVYSTMISHMGRFPETVSCNLPGKSPFSISINLRCSTAKIAIRITWFHWALPLGKALVFVWRHDPELAIAALNVFEAKGAQSWFRRIEN